MIWTVCGLRGPDKQPGVVPAGRRAGRWPSGGSGGLAQGLQVVPDIRRRPRVRLLSETMDELLGVVLLSDMTWHELDRLKADLEAQFPGWVIWVRPASRGRHHMGCRRVPQLEADPPEQLAELIQAAER